MFCFNSKQTAAVFLAVGLSTAPHGAVAEKRDASPDIVSATVRYPDLDLSTAAGAKALLRRIRYAAFAVCGDLPGDTLDGGSARIACVNAATAQAVSRVDRPMLDAAFNGRRDIVQARR